MPFVAGDPASKRVPPDISGCRPAVLVSAGFANRYRKKCDTPAQRVRKLGAVVTSTARLSYRVTVIIVPRNASADGPVFPPARVFFSSIKITGAAYRGLLDGISYLRAPLASRLSLLFRLFLFAAFRMFFIFLFFKVVPSVVVMCRCKCVPRGGGVLRVSLAAGLGRGNLCSSPTPTPAPYTDTNS